MAYQLAESAVRAGVTAARFAAASLLGRPQLLGVGWALTHVCTARCPFCDRHGGPSGIDTSSALALIDELAAAGCQRVHFTGGEPLTRSDLPELLARVRRHGMTSSVNTNGLLLTKRGDVIDACDAVLVSVDGPPEVHDGYRGPGSFDAMLRGLEVLRERRRPFLLSVTLFRGNLDHLDAVFALAERFDTRIVLQPGAEHILGSRTRNPEAPDVAAYRAVMTRLMGDRRRRARLWNSTPGLRQLAAWPAQHELRSHAGRITCRIDVHGNLYPCARAIFDASCNPPPNALELGVAEAFRRLPRIDCSEHVCQCAHAIEKNLLFGWNVSAWWSYLRRDVVGRSWLARR